MSDKPLGDTVDTTVRNLPRELHQRARERALSEHRTFSALVAEALAAHMKPPVGSEVEEPVVDRAALLELLAELETERFAQGVERRLAAALGVERQRTGALKSDDRMRWPITGEPDSLFDGDKGIRSLERWTHADEEWAILEDHAGEVLLGRSAEDRPALLGICNHGNPLAEEVYPALRSLMAKILGRAERLGAERP